MYSAIIQQPKVLYIWKQQNFPWQQLALLGLGHSL
jgi:hypothetical protein